MQANISLILQIAMHTIAAFWESYEKNTAQVDCTGIHRAKFVIGQVKPNVKNVSSLCKLYDRIEPMTLTYKVKYKYIVNEVHPFFHTSLKNMKLEMRDSQFILI
jgi:hypothetical protein